MRIHRDVTGDHEILFAVDRGGFAGTHGGPGEKLLLGRDVFEADPVELGMNILFHGE